LHSTQEPHRIRAQLRTIRIQPLKENDHGKRTTAQEQRSEEAEEETDTSNLNDLADSWQAAIGQ